MVKNFFHVVFFQHVVSFLLFRIPFCSVSRALCEGFKLDISRLMQHFRKQKWRQTNKMKRYITSKEKKDIFWRNAKVFMEAKKQPKEKQHFTHQLYSIFSHVDKFPGRQTHKQRATHTLLMTIKFPQLLGILLELTMK